MKNKHQKTFEGSSFISIVTIGQFNSGEAFLQIKFKNGYISTYKEEYPVLKEFFDKFVSSPSAGKFFHSNIKGNLSIFDEEEFLKLKEQEQIPSIQDEIEEINKEIDRLILKLGILERKLYLQKEEGHK